MRELLDTHYYRVINNHLIHINGLSWWVKVKAHKFIAQYNRNVTVCFSRMDFDIFAVVWVFQSKLATTIC